MRKNLTIAIILVTVFVAGIALGNTFHGMVTGNVTGEDAVAVVWDIESLTEVYGEEL